MIKLDLPRRYRVLLADDEPHARDLVALAFKQQDIELTIAQDGQQAMSLCESSLPDLAVLDWQMPHCTGLEVCRFIKEQSGKVFTPVIILTSQSEVTQKVEGLNCGADDYITKPFAFAEFLARIQAMFRIKALTDELHRTQNLLADRERQLLAVQLAGGAAHELGQPLTSIVLNCEILAAVGGQAKSNSEESRQILTEIKSEAKRVREILMRLQSFSELRLTSYESENKIVEFSPKDDDPPAASGDR